MFSTHYRKQLNLSGDALEASSEAVRRIGDFADRLERESAGTPALAEAAETLLIEVTTALSDDLNAPRAMGALFEFITAANREDVYKRQADGAQGEDGTPATRQLVARAPARRR